jgi:diaminopimelate decarboxylase
MTTHNQITRIERKYGTPFYIFDEKAFRGNYDNIARAFKSRYPKFILAYSYKTNYIPYLCKIIKAKGGFAEVVSRLEYDLAIKAGQDGHKIIFNGPVKKYEDIALALKNKSTVNLDSQTEVDYVKKYASKNPKQQIKIGIRINISLSDKAGQSHIQEKLPAGRFGFQPACIGSIIESLSKQKNITINSLHGHTSTTDRSVWCYKIITETLLDVAERYFQDSIEYINIGGGIFGYIPPKIRWIDTPSFDDYAQAVCDILKKHDWVKRKKPYLVLEPGIAMVANTISFITKVVSKKRIGRHIFVTVNGSAYNVKPTFHKINQPYKIVKRHPAGKIEKYNVVGSTCMEKDFLLTEITDTALEPGDFIMINNAGAYTVVLTPPFINPAPPILVSRQKGYKVIRKRQTLKDMFSNYLF